MKLNYFKYVFAALLGGSAAFGFAEELSVTMHLLNGPTDNASIGTITFKDTAYGLAIIPQLASKNLTPGIHGFHIHQNPSCANKGDAAGAHLDPNVTKQHKGPYVEEGHQGDLPALYVDENGNANLPLLAPRLSVKDVKEHALIIHAGGDNYSDTPAALGGGGARFACGVGK